MRQQISGCKLVQLKSAENFNIVKNAGMSIEIEILKFRRHESFWEPLLCHIQDTFICRFMSNDSAIFYRKFINTSMWVLLYLSKQ